MKLATLIIISSISLVSISLIVPSFLALTSFSDEFEKTVTSDITILTSNALDKVNRIMNARIIDTQFLTSNINLNLIGNYNSIKEKIDYLRDYEIQTQMYTSMSIYDFDGIKIGDTRNLNIGSDESNELFFTEAIQGKIYHDKIPVESKSLGISIIHFSGPMYDENGNVDGVLLLSFSLSKISDILASDVIYSKPIEVHLISNEGLILYSSHRHQGILTELTELTVYQNFLQSTDNQISFFEKIDEGDEALFTVVKQVGFHQYSGDGWVLIFDIPSAVLFEERDKEVTIFIIIAGIILSISITASFVIATRISSPIRKLEREMEKVSRSNFKISTVTGGGTEIESMSKSFEKMVINIKKGQTQIQAQLKELTKVDVQKDEFAAMVSHELKTPLVPIQLYTEMLLKGVLGSLDDKQIKALHSIQTNIESLTQLVDDVLDVTKLELGRLALHKKQVDLNDLLNKNIELLNVFAKEKKVTLEFDLKTSGKIFCDPNRINQVLSNLIKNSIDFVPEKNGMIKLIVEKNAESFVFTVTDNGPGIPIENQKHLFQKFYKIDTSPTRKHGGTGLGLTICNGIILSHGGKIWLDKEYTQGTCFKFTIPMMKS